MKGDSIHGLPFRFLPLALDHRQLLTTLVAIWPIAIDGSTSTHSQFEHGKTLTEFTCEAWDPLKDEINGLASETAGRRDASSFAILKYSVLALTPGQGLLPADHISAAYPEAHDIICER